MWIGWLLSHALFHTVTQGSWLLYSMMLLFKYIEREDPGEGTPALYCLNPEVAHITSAHIHWTNSIMCLYLTIEKAGKCHLYALEEKNEIVSGKHGNSCFSLPWEWWWVALLTVCRGVSWRWGKNCWLQRTGSGERLLNWGALCWSEMRLLGCGPHNLSSRMKPFLWHMNPRELQTLVLTDVPARPPGGGHFLGHV